MKSAGIWILGVVFIIFIIEFIQGRHKKVHRLQDGLMVTTAIIGSFITRPIVAFLTAKVIGFILPIYKGSLAEVSFYIGFPIIFLIAEFFQYWVHRFAHEPKKHPILYGMHRTHHSAPYVNVTLMYRANLFYVFIHPYTWVSATAFYLGMTSSALGFYVAIMTWNALTHSDYRWDDEIIKYVPFGQKIINIIEILFITPRIHHAHHGYGKNGKLYKNYCTMLSIYDRMFGTLFIPSARPEKYGMPGGEHNWARQMFFPFVPLGKEKPVEQPKDHTI